MATRTQWLFDLDRNTGARAVSGLIAVNGYQNVSLAPEAIAIMEKAKAYEAQYVFFEAGRHGRPPIAQALVFISDGPVADAQFAALHKRLWSWGGVPLVYRKTAGLVQLFRCAHQPDFEHKGKIVFKPFEVLNLASNIATEVAAHPWWDAERLHNGTLWDDPQVCKQLLSNKQAAQKTLINAVRDLHEGLQHRSILPKPLRRRLLILSILIAYLEARGVFEEDFFAQFKRSATNFFQVLDDGPALLKLLDHLEERFNGHVFVLKPEERDTLRESSSQLERFARLVEGHQERSGQLTLWQRYSFADLPVELISHIYQLFVKDSAVEVYTPHFVVRLMLGEVLSWERLDRLEKNGEVILDGACGSGVFLVEAYKRLVLHWRYRNNWQRPSRAVLTKLLMARLRGIDKEEGAVELAAFSLCLALCDALEPKEIRTSIKLFPPLKEKIIHTSCFFEALERRTVTDPVGVVVGNPPFTSKLGSEGAQRAYDRYQSEHGILPDKQLAYLFLHEPMQMLEPGGALCMLQQYNFLYNQQSLAFRRKFIERWDVREIFDFISVRGLFQKGNADTKVIVMVAEAQAPQPNRQILHAVFRRSGRTDAEQGFDIDYYDMHWLPRELALKNDAIWRVNLLGGGRLLSFVDRLKKLRTLGQFADTQEWNIGEGFIEGEQGTSRSAVHITGKPLLPSTALSVNGIDTSAITVAAKKHIESPRSAARFTPPMLLIREQMDLHHALWSKSYLTYKDQIVGIAAPPRQRAQLAQIDAFLSGETESLAAYVAATSTKLFTKKATNISAADIFAIPYPQTGALDISDDDKVLAADVVDYYRDLVRLGEDSAAMKEEGAPSLRAFNEVFTRQINGIYANKPLKSLAMQIWPGVICQPYVFGSGKVDWTGADELKNKIDGLLKEKRNGGLDVTRIARVYDGPCVYLLKPNRLRFWLRSIALRDADETLADLVAQGY
jgi:hypothetical protein